MAPIHHHYELKGWPEPRHCAFLNYFADAGLIGLAALSTLIMADYQGKIINHYRPGASPSFSCVDFLARGVTPRVMDTRMAPPGLDKCKP